ncbi:MAG: hypothetical protein ACOC6J_09770 [Spirochaetota bacterium]
MLKIPGRSRVRRTLLLLLIISSAVAGWAQPADPFAPQDPVVMGRGGSFTAKATGYNSFFANPAGFAGAGELTLASANVWAFMNRDAVSIARDIAAGQLPFGRSVTPRSVDQDAYETLQDDFVALQEWAASEDPDTMEDILNEAAGTSGIEWEEGDDIADVLAAAGTQDVVAFLEALDEAATASGSSEYPPGVVDNILATVDAALPSGYARVGGQVGLGYVGNGLGLGLFANTEATVDGRNILQASGLAYNTITFVGGLGLTFGNLDLGVSIRPTVFGYSTVNAAPIIGSYLAGGSIDFTAMFANTVYYGSGLGVDLGARWRLGPLSLGLAVKDLLGTRISYRKSDFGTYFDSLLAASLPVGSALTPSEQADAWTIPMKVNAGIEFDPDLGVLSYLIDPSFGVDLLDMTSAIRLWRSGEEITPDKLLEMLNFGGELGLLRFLTLRGGYYGGYISGGVGLDIFLIDINAAIAGDFGRDETGQWGFTNVGGSVELGIRF